MTNATLAMEPGFAGSEKRSGFARNWADYRNFRRTLADLRALTDRHLADIGMERVDLKAIARRAVYGN